MITPFKIPCVILSGGKSSRMGEDKALLPFSSFNSLAQYQYDRLKPYFKDIYISSKTNKFNFINEESLILDSNQNNSSPMLALDTIFDKIKTKKIFIITVDTPFVSINTISDLIEQSKNFDICVSQTVKVHNLCGVFSSSITQTIKNLLAEDIHEINFLLKKSKTNILSFTDENEFINLNSKIDYKKALNIIKNTYN